MCRAIVAERFPEPRRAGRGAEPGRPGARLRRAFRWVFDPLDGTTNYAHGLPIFCSSLALEIDGRGEVGGDLRPDARRAVHGRAGRGRVPERRAADHVSPPPALIDALLVTGFPYDVHKQPADLVAAVRRLPVQGAGGPPARVGRARPLLRRRRPVRRLLGTAPQAVGRRGRRADRHRSRRPITGMDGSPFDSRAAHLVASNGPRARRAARRHSRVPRRPFLKGDRRADPGVFRAQLQHRPGGGGWHHICSHTAQMPSRQPVLVWRHPC